MIVTMNSLNKFAVKAQFYWVITGTNNVPDGTGIILNLNGLEEWILYEDELIKKSKGILMQRNISANLTWLLPISR